LRLYRRRLLELMFLGFALLPINYFFLMRRIA
jgi:hypothetical protein